MRIERFRYIGGPNVHHHRPVLIAQIELEDLAERESRELEGFNDRLLERLPGLRTHTCGGGYEGCFVDRLRDGTYFGHIVEHVAIELSGQAGIGVCYGKTRVLAEPGSYSIVVRCRNEAAMRHLLQAALELVEATVANKDYPLEPAILEARRLVERTELGPSTRSIVDAAVARNIPVRRLDQHSSLVQLGYGRRRRLIQAAFTDGTGGVGVDIASDKSLTKQLLRDAFLPVPAGTEVETFDQAVQEWRDIGECAVVKPVDGHHGKGVTTEVRSIEALGAAFESAAAQSSAVLIEEQYAGNDYRVLVVNGSMVAASLRRPAEVVGDGARTIGELIDEINLDPRRGEGHSKPLSRVDAADAAVLAELDDQGLALEAVPEAGRVVQLTQGANLSTGGSAADVTDVVHPQVRALCERAARVIGLDICGIDLILPDISQPVPKRGGGIVEVNAGPGLRMHRFPSEGQPRDVGGAIVDMMFPGGSDGRIPIVAVTGTNGKTTVTRMIASVLASTGKTVGMTTTSGIHVGGREVAHGDMTGPLSARAILCDPAVEAAVLETARGGIVRGGLGYDWSDVAVMTNVQLDHVGQDGIENLDDIVHIKSLVVERVRDGGTVVLNADDPLVLPLADRPDLARRGCQVVLFSLAPRSFAVRRHVAAGGTAYVARGGSIFELCGKRSTPLVRIDAIPITFGGTVSFNVANALAAAAACRALGVSPGCLREAFGSFSANEHNSGRQNVFEVNGGKLVIDYGHNPAAFQGMGEALRKWSRGRVIGVLGAPGDRADQVLEEGARTAARAFDHIVLKEDEDKRGRRPGEVAQLLRDAIAAERPDLPCEIVLDEREALESALSTMRTGEVVVMFYDDLEVVREVLAGSVERAGRRHGGR
ncbi:MAG TPA: cyanophycin synthetase [Thermoanaerobaculia bacterium]|nr:cyanophycin synthetase [Thermoanaerobaculia bacterium]